MDSQNNSSTKIDVYQIVTDQIISLLEKGIIPWQQPWTGGMPMNLLSKREYRGINLWLLLSLNYEQNFFLTWDQLKSIGGSVNKDEKGHIVLYWKWPEKKADEDQEEKKKTVPLLRYYKVFNIAQCRDLPEQILPPLKLGMKDFEPLEQCEAIIKAMPDCPKIVHKEQKAYYDKATDIVNMPRKKSFKSIETYYSILYHELVHSTGAEKRLGRKTLCDATPFGSETYAMEELIAEMGSAYLSRISNIEPNTINNTVAYLDNWLGVFKKDKRFIVSASAYAQRAADFVLGRKDNESKEEVNESKEESMVI